MEETKDLSNMISEYAKLYRKLENKVFYKKGYSQFTIDFIQNNDYDFNDYAEDQPEFVETHISSMLYRVENILDVIKDGIDKDLFIDIYHSFEEVENRFKLK